MMLARSLQGRLLALVLGLVACVWLGSAAATWFDVRHELDELLDSHLAQAAAMLVAQQPREIDIDRGIDAPTLHRYAPQVAFQIFHEGRLALRSANAPQAPMFGVGGRFNAGFKSVTTDGVAWRVFAARGRENDIQVYVGERAKSRTSILRVVMRSTLWPMGLALPLLALAVWWAVRRGTAPLRSLGLLLAERRPEALQPVRVDKAPSEMAPMLAALNRLFHRTAERMESERRFTADAAHELRTPIAAIRAQAQAALGESDDARRRHALGATLEGCDRAARLVQQLLTLSRLEASVATDTATIELGPLVRDVVADLAPRALRKRQTIDTDALAPCRVRGDATLLKVLVRNLVDNAIRYGPPSALVKVKVSTAQGRVSLRIEDSGPGMSESDIGRLGERFFRALGSQESGSGLGWSIVQRIASAQQATVRVERSAALGGLAVEVQWRAQA